ncbi:hypothetical protein ACF06X_02410 [Streptomyces sp. NPDC015346]|uniref:hypothetical protein n=1 Tax=Streptomyces sp. NPDC015346 TaxID=3364954 RepID=UPI0036F68C62
MSITSPIPVLRGDKGTELRRDGDELSLRRPDDVVRIPLAAIARVRAERRDLAVELTAPAGAEPTVYRIKDVSAAAATVFADAVNAALPERAEGEETVDGSTLVVTRSLTSGDEDEGEEEEARGWATGAVRTAYAVAVVVAALAVVVGVLDKNWGRGIATLLLGELGVGATFLACTGLGSVWEEWYLPRYGITVDGQQVYRNGTTTNAYMDTNGVTRYVSGSSKDGTVPRVAYHPRKPQIAVVCNGRSGMGVGGLIVFLFFAGIAALIDYGTVLLALPAFGG